MSQQSLLNEFGRVGHPHVLVLGDLILDRYTWGNAERVSQEAPVVVLRADHREARLGGAANVCNMVRGLEAQVTCAGVVGQDEPGREMHKLLTEAGIDTSLVLNDESRCTTVKERIIGRASGRHPNQVVRVDYEVRDSLCPELESALAAGIRQAMPRFDAVLISDYSKGVCTPQLLAETIAAARAAGVPVLVDPARLTDLSRYRGATLLKPNRSETELATGSSISQPQQASRAGQELCEQYDLALAVVTLDRDGMVLVHRNGRGLHWPTRARAVYDITGAGDMVLAMLGVALASGSPPEAAVQLANIAGGLEVERTGATIITREEIRQELLTASRTGREKIVSLGQLVERLDEHRTRGQRIVLTNGCFDLLHVGHISYLAEAASQGDLLVVAINSDESVRRLKGPERPVIKEHDRAAMLAALSCVDYVLVFSEDTPHRILEAIRPDVLVKGGTYQPSEIVGREIVEQYGGRVCVTGAIDGVSTSNIIQSVITRRGQAA